MRRRQKKKKKWVLLYTAVRTYRLIGKKRILPTVIFSRGVNVLLGTTPTGRQPQAAGGDTLSCRRTSGSGEQQNENNNSRTRTAAVVHKMRRDFELSRSETRGLVLSASRLLYTLYRIERVL